MNLIRNKIAARQSGAVLQGDSSPRRFCILLPQNVSYFPMYCVIEIGDSTDPNANAEEKLSLYQDWMELRTADIGFVLDAIETAKAAGEMSDVWFLSEESRNSILSVLEKIDMHSVGLMGHSMGGAASAALGRKRDDVSAVIDLDGTMLAEYVGIADGQFVLSDQPYELDCKGS